MIKCGLYARVSTDLQAEVKNGSLDTQIDLLQKSVEIKDSTSPEEEWKAVATYREEGKSGKNLDRPEYKRMIRDIEGGKINAVLCTKIDRVSRSIVDFYQFHEFLEEKEAIFISINENLDTSTAMGRFALSITLATAELERERTSERTKEKMQWRAEKGLHNGGQILGYDNDPDDKGVPKSNEAERELVLLIFQTYVKEQSFRATAQIINGKGYRTKSYVSRRDNVHLGKKFNNTHIMRILQNEFYIGKIAYNGEVYEGQHEPIIPMALWNKVQAIIEAKRVKRSKSRKQNLHTFLLQGLVKCGWCKSYMTPYYGMNHQKKPYFYYQCTCKIHRGNKECKMKPVPAQALEKVVTDRLIQLNDDQKRVQDLIAEATTNNSERMKSLTQAQKNYQRLLKDIDKKLDALVESIAGRKVGIKTISQKIIDLEEQKSQIEQEMLENESTLAELKQKAVSVAQIAQKLTTFEELFDEATPEERKDLLRLHINHLIYTPDGIQLALFDSVSEADRIKVQRKDVVGCPSGIRTPIPGTKIQCLAIRRRGNTVSRAKYKFLAD